jgi:polyisoprenoid-binding protein YceI
MAALLRLWGGPVMSRFAGVLCASVLTFVVAGPAFAVPTLDPAQMPAGTYVLDQRHASLEAHVRHMGLSNFTMRFRKVDAHFDYDPKDPMASKVEVTVDVNSLDTGDAQYGPKFAKDFLDGEHFPTATFVSTGFKQLTPTSGVMTGDLTLRGVTKPVDLNVVFDGYESGIVAGRRAGFSATGRIHRDDFGIKFIVPGIIGDDVDLAIEVEFTRT